MDGGGGCGGVSLLCCVVLCCVVFGEVGRDGGMDGWEELGLGTEDWEVRTSRDERTCCVV